MNGRKLPKVMRPSHLKKLFGVVENPIYFMAYILTFFLGLRKGEICRLMKKDIDIENKIVTIRDSKNPKRSKHGYGKDRLISLPMNLIPLIELWFEYSDSEYVLPMRNGKNIPYCHLTLWKKFKSDIRKAGLDNNEKGYDKAGRRMSQFTFHSLRHAYGTYLYEQGVPLHTIQALMGHSDTRTTLIYVELSTQKKQEEVDKAFCNNNFQKLMDREIQRDNTSLSELELLKEQNKAKELELKRLELMKELNPIQIERTQP